MLTFLPALQGRNELGAGRDVPKQPAALAETSPKLACGLELDAAQADAFAAPCEPLAAVPAAPQHTDRHPSQEGCDGGGAGADSMHGSDSQRHQSRASADSQPSQNGHHSQHQQQPAEDIKAAAQEASESQHAAPDVTASIEGGASAAADAHKEGSQPASQPAEEPAKPVQSEPAEPHQEKVRPWRPRLGEEERRGMPMHASIADVAEGGLLHCLVQLEAWICWL